MLINIHVRNKIARLADADVCVVCGNKGYVVKFDFDEEWDVDSVKTAIFKWNGEYEEVPFTGTECPIPPIHNARLFHIGVYSGDIRTSTDALVPARRSTRCGKGVHHEPPEDVYDKLVQMIEDGKVQGNPGITPHIGVNGTWFIGDEDTGVKAEGADYVITQKDKEDITRAVLASLPTWNGGEY